MSTQSSNEGYIPVTGGRVWYKMVGTANAVPLLTLHGGPGSTHDVLEPMAALADERPILFYDQLGSGKSDRPDDVSLWRTERFVEELDQVRRALGLTTIHLYGLSWGSMLAAAYMLTKPAGVQSLILAGPCMSVPRFEQDALTLKRQLPTDVLEVLEWHEQAGTTDSEEYQNLKWEFYKRHVCRIFPFPEDYLRARAGFGQAVYNTMWGPSEFYVTGSLKDFDITPRLHEITVPTLFTCGRYDECTPEATAWYQSLLPGSKMAVFENSSHTPMLEEPERYNEVIRDFLSRVERTL
jgi:proline iminopeptidase